MVSRYIRPGPHDVADVAVFNQAFILNAFHLLLNKLLPLTSTDLESLEDEPEEWLIAEKDDEEAWAFEFRVSRTTLTGTESS